jgi:hypothetical protein
VPTNESGQQTGWHEKRLPRGVVRASNMCSPHLWAESGYLSNMSGERGPLNGCEEDLPEAAARASAERDGKDGSRVSRVHRLPAVRIGLLTIGVVLLSATAVALANTGPFQAIASSRLYKTTSATRVAKRRTRRGKPTSPTRSRCVVAAHEHRHRRHRRKAGRSCVAKRLKKKTKPSASLKRAGSAPSSSPPSGAAPGNVSGGAAPAEPVPPGESAAPFRFFSATSFWNKSLPVDAPLDPSSAAVVGAFDEEIAAEESVESGPWINATYYSVPIYTVPAGQPVVKVTLEDASKSPTLQSAWDAVPLPPDAQPAVGGDKHLVVWQPSTDRLWEFWHLEMTAAGWKAGWGGAMRHALSSPGVYTRNSWPGARSFWGASGTSLSIAGGLITLEDLEKGRINHALAMAVPNVRAGVYASPAERSDGESTEPLSLPEGAHLRLDPNLNLAALHLPRLTLMIAEAAQRYGIFVRDAGGEVAFYAQDPIPTGIEPYAGTHGYFEGESPLRVLESFPWSHLQLLKMELHSTS